VLPISLFAFGSADRRCQSKPEDPREKIDALRETMVVWSTGCKLDYPADGTGEQGSAAVAREALAPTPAEAATAEAERAPGRSEKARS
jgi:hypothetical protein